MSNEIDRLEIVVDTEASKANRSLGKLEKRIGGVAEKLEKIMALSGVLGNIGEGVGLESFKQVDEAYDSILEKIGKLNGRKAKPKVDRDDLKYTSKTLDEIYEKFKNVGSDVDVSDMGLPELEREAKNLDATVKRLTARLEKKASIEGTDNLGKSWENLIYDIQKATNMLEVYRNEIKKVKGEQGSIDDVPIHHWTDNLTQQADADNSIGDGKGGYQSYDASAIQDFIDGNDIAELNTFEAQIKRLKAELASLASQGYSQYDPEYDRVAQELAEVVEAQKRYNKELRKNAQAANSYRQTADATKKFGYSLGELNSKLKTARKSFSKTASSIGKFIKKLRTARKESGRGFSIPKMVGMSVLFSSVFQVIQAIKNAIAEGSNNLVQYSSTYNKSISSVVSALTYLKNAWAAAFAPIVNIVAPYLQSFIDMVGTALNAVGRFLSVLTGKGFAVQAKKVTQDYADSLGGVADSAGGASDAVKKLQKTIFGFDKMNILNAPNEASGGGGASGGTGSSDLSPYDMFETVEVENSMSNLANKVKEAWANADFTEIGGILGDKLNEGLENIEWTKIKGTTQKIAKSVATFLNGFIDETDWNLVGETFAEGINTIIELGYTFVTEFNWKKFGTAIGNFISGAFKNIDWGKAGKALSNGVIGILDTIHSALGAVEWHTIGESVGEFLTAIDWLGVFTSLNEVLIEAIKGSIDLAAGFTEAIIDGVKNIEWADVVDAFLTSFPTINIVAPIMAEAVFDIEPAAGAIAGAITSAISAQKPTLNFESKIKLTKDGWGTLPGFIGIVPSGLKQKINRAKGWGSQTMSGFVGIVNSLSQTINRKKGWSSTLSSWIGIASKGLSQKINLKKGWSGTIKKWLGIADAFKLKFTLPKIKVKWGSKTVAGFTIKYPNGFSTYAKGGFPNTGEMFVANEAGPEMVGKMGRKNVVANNRQITQGIASAVGPAVFSAMMEANKLSKDNGNSNGKNELHVHLGNKEIFDYFVDEVTRRTRLTGTNPVMV